VKSTLVRMSITREGHFVVAVDCGCVDCSVEGTGGFVVVAGSHVLHMPRQAILIKYAIATSAEAQSSGS
jgi:hypothetical protein